MYTQNSEIGFISIKKVHFFIWPTIYLKNTTVPIEKNFGNNHVIFGASFLSHMVQCIMV